MSRKFAELIQVELEQIRQMLEQRQSLIDQVSTRMPTDIELDSLAVLLHSFYNGVERILVLISKDSETFANIEQMTANWHQSLLLSYNSDDNSQRFSLPEELTNRLLDYLKFRHMFRHAYSFELKWTRMQHLVAGLNQAFIDFLSTLKGYYNF